MTLIWKREGKEWWLYQGDCVLLKLVPWFLLLPLQNTGDSTHIPATEADVFYRWAMGNVVDSNELEIEMDAELVANLRDVAERVNSIRKAREGSAMTNSIGVSYP